MKAEVIKLHEAITKPIDNELVWVWTVFGKHIEDADITEEYTVEKTFVIKSEYRNYEVGVEMTKVGDKGEYLGIVAEVSTMEELQEKFPQLFELTGEFFIAG